MALFALRLRMRLRFSFMVPLGRSSGGGGSIMSVGSIISMAGCCCCGLLTTEWRKGNEANEANEANESRRFCPNERKCARKMVKTVAALCGVLDTPPPPFFFSLRLLSQTPQTTTNNINTIIIVTVSRTVFSLAQHTHTAHGCPPGQKRPFLHTTNLCTQCGDGFLVFLCVEMRGDVSRTIARCGRQKIKSIYGCKFMI